MSGGNVGNVCIAFHVSQAKNDDDRKRQLVEQVLTSISGRTLQPGSYRVVIQLVEPDHGSPQR